MTTLFLIICVIAVIWYIKIEKEKRTVKAFAYLKVYSKLKAEGKQDDEASVLANGYVEKYIFGNETNKTREERWTEEASMHLRCGGNPSKTIAMARELGFSK